MRKAKLSVHKSDVQAVLRAFSIEVPANSLDELAEVSEGVSAMAWNRGGRYLPLRQRHGAR